MNHVENVHQAEYLALKRIDCLLNVAWLQLVPLRLQLHHVMPPVSCCGVLVAGLRVFRRGAAGQADGVMAVAIASLQDRAPTRKPSQACVSAAHDVSSLELKKPVPPAKADCALPSASLGAYFVFC